MNLSAITELRAAQVYLDAGFRTLDISFCGAIYEGDLHDPILDGGDWLARIDGKKARLDALGIRVGSTHLPYRYDFADTSAPTYPCHYEMTRRALIASQRLGAEWTVVHVADPDSTVAHVKKLFSDTGVETVGIAIENMVRLPIENVIQVHDQLKAQGFRVGVCLDLGHCHINVANDYDVSQVIRQLGSRIVLLHIHDNNRSGDQHKVPYAGSMPWQKIMKALKEIGFRGDFNYELNLRPIPDALKPSYLRFAVDAANFLIGVYNEHKEET